MDGVSKKWVDVFKASKQTDTEDFSQNDTASLLIAFIHVGATLDFTRGKTDYEIHLAGSHIFHTKHSLLNILNILNMKT